MMGLPEVGINRSLRPGTYQLSKVIYGMEKFGVLRSIFGKDPKKVVANTKVILSRKDVYAYIDVPRRSIAIGHKYYKSASEMYLCLDVIHELVHLRQLSEGHDLFDPSFEYVDRPTEIEAYKVAASQARKFGLKGRALRKYLEVDWVPKKESDRLLRRLRVK